MTLLAAAGNTKLLWYVTRGSGVVALLLLTGSMLLGVLSAVRFGRERWPRFAVNAVHRNLTLLSIVFVSVHVVTTVADGFAPIGLKDGLVPFLSPYRTIWLGLGTVAFDLLLALVVTSLLRARIGPRLWRAVHWLAYLSWPVALVHSLGTGSDARLGWLALLGFGCLAAVALAALARIAVGGGHREARLAGAATALLAPLLVFVWYSGGPARHGWARRAGTPGRILTRTAPATVPASSSATRVLTAATPSAPTSFAARVSGRVGQSQSNAGFVTVRLDLRLHGGPGGAARLDLRGLPAGGGVSLTASGISFVPATTRSVYTGSVVALAGPRVDGVVVDAAGHRLLLHFSLRIDPQAGRVTGHVRASTPAQGGDAE